MKWLKSVHRYSFFNTHVDSPESLYLTSHSGESNKKALRQIVLMESRATLRKIALWWKQRDRFEPRLLKPFEQSELRIQYQASARLSARKLQTLGKCSSTNLESFTFRLLTQLTQGVFLRSASFLTLFDGYFVKQ